MTMDFELQEFFSPKQMIRNRSFAHFGNPETTYPGTLVFCEDIEHLHRALQNPNVSAIVTRRQDFDRICAETNAGIAVAEHPRLAYWQIFIALVDRGVLRPEMEFGCGSGCKIHPTASISNKAWIGDDVTVEAHASIGDYCIVQTNSLIGAGARIGADGLENVRAGDRRLFIRHAGGVRLGERVVVLANAVVSRGVYPVFTSIGDDTHISLLCSIGHQSELGRRCSIAGNCLVGGSVEIGDDVILGPSVTIKDGVRIGNRARIRLGSVVIEDVEDDADISGNFAVRHISNLRNYVRSRNDSR
jgi:acyl-[acyl carrier protein]--UDP-N-acetylglucosamine O-acyltransferase